MSSIKKRIFGEYIPGPKTNGKTDYTRILITKKVPFEEARSTLEASPEYKPTRHYVMLQTIPNTDKDIDVVFI